MRGGKRHRVMCLMRSVPSDMRSQSFSVSMTDLIAIPFTHGQAIYRLFSLGDYLYMNKCQRIGYLLQGALQYD